MISVDRGTDDSGAVAETAYIGDLLVTVVTVVEPLAGASLPDGIHKVNA